MSRALYKFWLYEILPDMRLVDISDGSNVLVSGSDVVEQLARYDERTYISSNNDVTTAAAAVSALYALFASTHTADIIRLHNALTAEYKPLDNYNMVESESDNRSINRDYTRNTTANNTRTDDLSEVAAHTGTVGTEGTTTGKNEDGTTITTTNTDTIKDSGTSSESTTVSAYDTSDLVPTGGKSGTTGNERTATNNNSVVHSGNISTSATSESTVTNDTKDTVTNTGTVEDSGTSSIIDTEGTKDNLEHTLTRSGNIGVTTSQQMLTSEIMLRVHNQLLYYVVELFVSQYLTW